MNNPLIINARRQLRWHQRLGSDASTFALWAMWLWICRPVLIPGSLRSVNEVLVWLVGTGAALMLWNRLSSSPARRPVAPASPDYAAHFGITQQEIGAGRASRVCVVHHDEQGRIVCVQPLSAEVAAPSPAVAEIPFAAAA